MQDKGRLETTIQDMRVGVLRVVKDHPELHYKLSLLLNHTSTSPPPPSASSPPPSAAEQGGVARQEGEEHPDLVLSDDAMDTLVDDLIRT